MWFLGFKSCFEAAVLLPGLEHDSEHLVKSELDHASIIVGEFIVTVDLLVMFN